MYTYYMYHIYIYDYIQEYNVIPTTCSIYTHTHTYISARSRINILYVVCITIYIRSMVVVGGCGRRTTPKTSTPDRYSRHYYIVYNIKSLPPPPPPNAERPTAAFSRHISRRLLSPASVPAATPVISHCSWVYVYIILNVLYAYAYKYMS